MSSEQGRFRVLDSAIAAIQDRDGTYGNPILNYERMAVMMNVILKDKLEIDLNAADAVMVMCGIKMARLINTPDHRDSQVDLAGYAAILSEVA